MGKLIEMADKDYVAGDIYEMMLPIKEDFDTVAGKSVPSGSENRNVKKVTLEENPLDGDNWS